MAKLFFEELCGTCHEENGYLKEHKRVTYINLLTSGKLNIYLVDIDKQTQERFERLIEQMKQAQGIAEQLKVENALEWTGRLNNIRACAREIVNKEIYQIHSIYRETLGCYATTKGGIRPSVRSVAGNG